MAHFNQQLSFPELMIVLTHCQVENPVRSHPHPVQHQYPSLRDFPFSSVPAECCLQKQNSLIVVAIWFYIKIVFVCLHVFSAYEYNIEQTFVCLFCSGFIIQFWETVFPCFLLYTLLLSRYLHALFSVSHLLFDVWLFLQAPICFLHLFLAR